MQIETKISIIIFLLVLFLTLLFPDRHLTSTPFLDDMFFIKHFIIDTAVTGN